MNKIPMTVSGAEKLRQELQYLKTVARPRITAAIGEARKHGDLRENAEYHAAKEQQGFTEARIRDIEHKLSNCQVIDPSTVSSDGKVVFGAEVTLVNLDTDQTVSYQIVGEDEADLKSAKISITSPIARALIGKRKGDCVDVNTPGGIVPYEIEEVSFPS